jgi:hypothetical protein
MNATDNRAFQSLGSMPVTRQSTLRGAQADTVDAHATQLPRGTSRQNTGEPDRQW